MSTRNRLLWAAFCLSALLLVTGVAAQAQEMSAQAGTNMAAMKFVNAVADIAEKSQHHPDIDIRWNKVTLALSTHDAGGLTKKDFDLATQFDRL